MQHLNVRCHSCDDARAPWPSPGRSTRAHHIGSSESRACLARDARATSKACAHPTTNSYALDDQAHEQAVSSAPFKPCSEFEVVQLKPSLIPKTAALLAIAFSQSIDADIFRRYLLRQITDYLRSTCKMRDSCAVVVALASDAEGSDSCDNDGEDPAWSSADDPASGDVRAAEQHHGGAAPSGRHTAEGLSSSEARAARQAAAPRRQTASGTFEHERHMPIVGTSMVSFDTRSRNKSLTLNPPDDQPFLTNMAVCQDYQRRGVATQLLHACEAHALRKWRRPCTMYLSARIKDEPAVRLYLKEGYEIVKTDWPAWRFIGLEPMHLMTKNLDTESQS